MFIYLYLILEGVIFQKVSPETKEIISLIKKGKYKYRRTKLYDPLFTIKGIEFRPFAFGRPFVNTFIENNYLYFNRKEEILIANALLKEEKKQIEKREKERRNKTLNKIKKQL